MATNWVSNGSGNDVTNAGAYASGQQSVQDIHNRFAVAGDTITVPAGNWVTNSNYTWTATTTITKGIQISGPTTGTAYIKSGTGGARDMVVMTSGTDNHITFGPNIWVYYTANGGGANFTLRVARTLTPNTNQFTVLIHDCLFNGGQVTSQGGDYAIIMNNNGIVMWNCTFIGNGANNFGGFEAVCPGYGYTSLYNTADTFGATPTFSNNGATQLGVGEVNTSTAVAGLNSSYVENCAFYDMTETNCNWDDNSKGVMRYNLSVMALVYASHGQETSLYGTKSFEVYNNTGKICNTSCTLGAFNQPAIGSSVTVSASNTSALFTGFQASTSSPIYNQMISLNGGKDLYFITAVTGTTITIQNIGWPLGTAANLGITSQALCGPSGAVYTPTFNWAFWMNMRGGTGIVTGNNLPPIATNTGFNSSTDFFLACYALTRNINGGTGTFSPAYRTGTQGYNGNNGYPCPHQVGWGWSSGSVAPWGAGQASNAALLSNASGSPLVGNFAPDGTGATLDPVYIWNNTNQNGPNYVNVDGANFGNNSAYPNINAGNFIQQNEEYYLGQAMPGWSPYTFPHPLTGQTGGGPPPPTTTAGSGITAAADLALTRTVVGVTSGAYVTPTNNWVALYSTQFTAQAKAGATEWTTASDTAPYARVAMGAAGAGWTIAAYVSGTGVVFSNTNQITFTAVAGNAQTLYAVGWCDSVGPTGGNVDFFVDLANNAQLSVPITVQVVLKATAGANVGAQFTTF